MKKIIAMILAFVMLFSVINASAKVPEALKREILNCTAAYTTGVSLESADSIVSLVEETGVADDISRHVDLKKLLESLCSSKTEMLFEYNVSEDYKKYDIAMTSKGKQKITANSNFSADISYSSGMWMQMDMSGENPRFLMAFNGPLSEKYAKIDLFDMIPKEEASDIVALYSEIVSPDFVKSITDVCNEGYEKYADIEKINSRKYVVHMDNDNFVKLLEEVMEKTMKKLAEAIDKTSEAEDTSLAEFINEIPFNFDGLKLLGKDGATWEYTLTASGNISTCRLEMDLEFEIANIYELITGQEWMYNSRGVINLNTDVFVDITKIGKTTPQIPVLTEENSYDLIEQDSYPDYEDYDDGSYETEIGPYISGYSEKIVEKDGIIYFNAETLLKECYGDNLEFITVNGTTTCKSALFPVGDTITINGKTAVTGDASYDISEPIYDDGVLYLGEDFFANVLGWNLSEYSEDLLEGVAYYSFICVNEEENSDEFSLPYWVYGEYSEPVVLDGMCYVPLRATLENAYQEYVEIGYNNGKVTIRCPYFDSFEEITLETGKSGSFTDGILHDTGKVILHDNSVFVSTDFFENIFGWEVEYVNYNRKDNYTSYEFVTNFEDIYEYDE